MGHSYSCNLIHLVFSTKERAKLIRADIERPLWDNLIGIGRNHEIPVIAVGGMPDHIHLLYGLPSTMDLSRSIQIFKANSSRWMKPHITDFAWQEGSGAFGISESGKNAVVQYIRNQAEHHKRRSFEDEFIALLKKYKIDYDPRYVFG